MQDNSRSRVASGILLILLGLLFLSYQIMPAWWSWLNLDLNGPLLVIAVGVLILVVGLLAGAPGLAVPACVVGGIGGILYWQTVTQRWETWSYAWTLIPGFVGVGVILAGLMRGSKIGEALEGGIWTILTSLVMFAIFGSFLGGLNILGVYWPVLLIAAGLLVFLRGFLSRSRP